MTARIGIRIVAVGDSGTGKSSLIASAAANGKSLPENIPPVLPPTTLPTDCFPDHVPVTLIDTSSSFENRGEVAEELKRADAVVLTYACDQPMTLGQLSSFWLHELRRLEVKVPMIVVGCKLDLQDDLHQINIEQVLTPIMQQFGEIQACIECSAVKQVQVKCFNTPLQPAEIEGVKRVILEKLPWGVSDIGLTFPGFLFLHALFIEKGRIETTWTVLRKFGYNDEIKLRNDLLPVPSRRSLDQSIELTDKAMEFLRSVFAFFDRYSKVKGLGRADVEVLRPTDLENLFFTAPESTYPDSVICFKYQSWAEAPYKEAAERIPLGLTLNGFLSTWALMTLLDPAHSLANLIYVGYTDDPASAFRVTRERSLDRKKKQTDRSVINCFVFGPKNAGKTALLDSFVGRPFSESYTSTTAERYATNFVDLGGIKKILILREIPEDKVQEFLSHKVSLATCDVSVFVYDSSDEQSWKRATELLLQVAKEGEGSGFGVPCLLIPSKYDLSTNSMALEDTERVCRDMGIEAPIPVSFKSGEFNNVYSRIVKAAEHPHLSIPVTEAGRRHNKYLQLVNQSLMFVSVGAASVLVLAAAARKNSSG